MTGVAVCCGTVSSIKSLWETRIKKTKQDLQKQQDLKAGVGRVRHNWEDRITLAKLKEKVVTAEGRVILRLENEEWKTLPKVLVHFSQLMEWHLHRIGLERIPSFVSSFENLIVLDLSRNAITEIPKEIGKMAKLRELLVSYNRVQSVPGELGCCQNLEKLELAGNRDLDQLPAEISDLKKLYHLDLSLNQFTEIPESVVSLPALEWLDMGGNRLQCLPIDIHRMERLHTMWLQRNELEFLPDNICYMPNLDTLVLSNNKLQDIPSMMEDMNNLRFVNFRDNPLTYEVKLSAVPNKSEDDEEDDREMFGRDFMRLYCQEARKRVNATLDSHSVNPPGLNYTAELNVNLKALAESVPVSL
ncbi:hypothetical protein DPEC_G00270710 [Dallia pectoralis]|uniref:Uncharacterized protein n=1 Tax=Dallia pectoralis TaxID=75939 RepID=A0ACC2FPK9_DALPE|nr:hypothetical protein DPEC_G00270710 [Dallia pectoralis]